MSEVVESVALPTASAAADPDTATAEWLAVLAEVVPVIQKCRETIETQRGLTPALVDTLRDAGLYRLWVPRELGGYEVHPLTMLAIVAEVARHDGSVAWALMAGANSALLAARMPREGGQEVFGDPRGIIAGSLHDGGTARAVTGGYLLSGQWRLASGCREATWIIASARVSDAGDDRTVLGDRPHTFLVPRTECTVLETWNAVGMRGSGTHEFAIAETFVPSHRVIEPPMRTVIDGPLYRPAMAHFINPPLAALALGIAGDAIAVFTEIALRKRSRNSDQVIAARHSIQEKVGEAHGLVDSGWAYLREATRELWAAAQHREPIDRSLTAKIMLSTASATANAVRTVNTLYTAAGSTSIMEANRLARCFRDVNVVNHHDAAAPAVLERAGRYFLYGN
ncbi:acyl-CoA dehydrogenase family protein [Nocardia arizonensis]|uniref:acyl-CoA dehydrogenase family protein n=1 Tax=Nocardia arizonensis TaxID=1141647 RepID=UPI0006D05356|nr:acyl-CoA dehydrogenase family protein [Nocardia arizonensis]